MNDSFAAPLPTDNDKTMAMFAHLGGALMLLMSYFGIIVPIVIYNVKKDSPYVRNEARKVLNAYISYFIQVVALVVVGAVIIVIAALTDISALLFLLIPLGLLILAIFILNIVMSIVNAIRCSNRQDTSYPLSMPLLK
jgi:uncharacterized Tic20 family protein